MNINLDFGFLKLRQHLPDNVIHDISQWYRNNIKDYLTIFELMKINKPVYLVQRDIGCA